MKKVDEDPTEKGEQMRSSSMKKKRFNTGNRHENKAAYTVRMSLKKNIISQTSRMYY